MNAVAVGSDVAFVVAIDDARLGEDEVLLKLRQDASTPNARQHISYCHIRLFLWIAGDYACRALSGLALDRPFIARRLSPCLYRPVGRTLSIRDRGYVQQPPTPRPFVSRVVPSNQTCEPT